jgi:hypothetical protein
MKLQVVSRILFAGLAVLLLQACATTAPTTGTAALAGTWTNSLGTVWTMTADGSFEVDLNHDGKRDAWGKCTVEGKRHPPLHAGQGPLQRTREERHARLD